MPSLTPYRLRKKEFFALLALGLLILVGKLVFVFLENRTDDAIPEVTFSTQKPTTIVLTEFDPNELDAKQWQQLGFTEKQAKTILKYKQVVGGAFQSKQQFQKCYSISPEKYQQLKPYLLLPEKASGNTKQTAYSSKKISVKKAFNPDYYRAEDWQKLGFSQKQAEAILKYKSFLGGGFLSKEKFKECFVISAENYQILHHYLLLPEKTPEKEKAFFKNPKDRSTIAYQDFDPNQLDAEGWQKLGFSEKQAKVIVNYRDKILKGNFKSLEELQRCFVISEEKFNQIKPYIKFNSSSVTSTNTDNPSVNKSHTTDFTQTDLNKITFKQLVEFGFDEKSAAGFIGFRNKLGGFVNKKQILETYNLDKALASKLLEIAPLAPVNIEKFTLTEAPEEWLKSHPYFRYHAGKIIFYRESYPSDQEIFKKMKLKPEEETKMKMYLK